MPDTKPFGAFAPAGLVARILEKTRAAADSWLAKRIAFLLRRIALKRLRGAPVDIETYGARMRLLPYNNVCEKRVLFTPQFFDPLERQILEARIRDGFVFVDIGANIGAYSLFVAMHAGASARILAVEPQPDIFRPPRLQYQPEPGRSDQGRRLRPRRQARRGDAFFSIRAIAGNLR